jgi:hypothetical protein
MSRAGSIRLFALLCSAAVVLHAQTPEWIWGAKPQDGEKRSFLKEFLVPAGIERAVLTVAADNRAQVLLDGKPIGSNESWSQPTRLRIPSLPAGSHRLEIEAGNEDGAAGLLVRLELHAAGSRSLVVSDSSWQTRSLPTSAWVPAVSIGQLGVQPWGEVSLDAEATSAASLRVPSGFRVELLHSSEAGQGSWVSMTVDDRGRLIVGPQGSEPLLRFTLDDAGKVVRTDPIGVPLRGAMGLLWSQGVLYANAAGSQGYALHRIRDTAGSTRWNCCGSGRVTPVNTGPTAS